MDRKKLTIISVLLIAIVLVVNIISKKISFRLDFTEDNIYTLSNATKDILKNIEEPVTVKAYFSEQLPPNIIKIKNDVNDFLIEYSNTSNDMLVFEFVNTDAGKEAEEEAMKNGIRPVMLNIREKYKYNKQKIS